MYMQIGFHRSTKTYSTPDILQTKVEQALAKYIQLGYVFNILCVEHTVDGKTRYVPLLNCWRNGKASETEIMQARLAAARLGFTVFA